MRFLRKLFTKNTDTLLTLKHRDKNTLEKLIQKYVKKGWKTSGDIGKVNNRFCDEEEYWFQTMKKD